MCASDLEIWDLYEQGLLHPDTQLTGRYERVAKAADVEAVFEAIADAADEAASRMGGAPVEGHQVKPSRRQGRRNKKRRGRWD